MTSEQKEFLNSLTTRQREQFLRMSNSEKSKFFNSYLAQKSDRRVTPKSRNVTNTLLSTAINKFGPRGKQYVQENFEMFGGDVAGAGIEAGLSGASRLLTTGDTGQAVETAVIAGGSNYASNFLNELIGEQAVKTGTKAFETAISGGQTPIEAQFVGEEAARGFGATYGPAASGAVSGLTNYFLTGDEGEALETGITTGGSQYLTQYAGNVIKDQAVSRAIETGATRTAANAAGAQVAANFIPVIGGAVGAITGALTEKDPSKRVAAAGKGAIYGTTAAMGPYGWAAAAVMSAADIATQAKKKKRVKRRSTWFQYDNETGEMSLTDDNIVGGDSMNEFSNNQNARLNLHYGLKDEADRRMDIFNQVTSGMSEDEKSSFREGLGIDYFNPVVKVDKDNMVKIGNLTTPEQSSEYFSQQFSNTRGKSVLGDDLSPDVQVSRLADLRGKGWAGTLEEMDIARQPEYGQTFGGEETPTAKTLTDDQVVERNRRKSIRESGDYSEDYGDYRKQYDKDFTMAPSGGAATVLSAEQFQEVGGFEGVKAAKESDPYGIRAMGQREN